MKKNLIAFLGIVFILMSIFVFAVTIANAATAKFAWDASPSVGVTGYKLYVDGSEPVDVGNVLEWQTELEDGVPHEVYATAYNVDGNESGPSNKVQFKSPLPPLNMRVTISVQIEINQ